jgi:RHS repeat-associated protein
MRRLIWAVMTGILLMPATARAQDDVVYYHTDAIGSVRMISDEAGTIIARYDYTPFGQPWNPPSTAELLQFTGKERDLQTELDYFLARDFMSLTGRFTTVDPGHVNGNVEDPQSWNAYAYARNNPFVYTDPSGTEYQICAFGGGDFPGSCGWISNSSFYELLSNPGSGFRLSNNWIYQGNNRVGTYRVAGFGDFAQLTGALSSAWLREQGSTMAKGAVIAATGGVATGAFSGGLAASEVLGISRVFVGVRPPSPGQLASMQRLLAQQGRRAVEKSIRSHERLIVEHIEKMSAVGGDIGSLQREIRNYRELIAAAKRVLGR